MGAIQDMHVSDSMLHIEAKNIYCFSFYESMSVQYVKLSVFVVPLHANFVTACIPFKSLYLYPMMQSWQEEQSGSL